MTNAIINMLDKKVCTLDNGAKEEIKNIVDALTECEPIDIAIDISEIEIFDCFDTDTISVMVEEKIIEFKHNLIQSLNNA